MPYILGRVTQKTETSSTPCMNFQVKCINKPYINPVICYVPPSFFVGVPQDEYVFEITSNTGVSTTVVASALSAVGGGVVLNVALG